MIETILVPVDGSRFGERAVAVAVTLARRSGAYLHIVQVHVSELALISPEGFAYADPVLDLELKRQEERYLAELVVRYVADSGVRVRTELLEGPIADTLKTYASEAGVDMVVMTTHGRGGVSRVWLGSVADALVRQLRLPVLLLRPRTDPADVPPCCDNVLIPLDGSELSERVISCAVATGRLSNASYTLLRVISPAYVAGKLYSPALLESDPLGLDRQQADAEVYLRELAERMRTQGLEVETAVMIHSQPALGILEFAEAHHADLIAMATHGRGGWVRLALGSVADKVLRAASRPVLLYRPTLVGQDRWSSAASESELEAVPG